MASHYGSVTGDVVSRPQSRHVHTPNHKTTITKARTEDPGLCNGLHSCYPGLLAMNITERLPVACFGIGAIRASDIFKKGVGRTGLRQSLELSSAARESRNGATDAGGRKRH